MDEHSSITNDDETAYRERATALLDEFAAAGHEGYCGTQALALTLSSWSHASGDVILTFGTAAELYSEDWKAIRATVSSLVRRSIGLDPAQCRDVVCAMAHAVEPPA